MSGFTKGGTPSVVLGCVLVITFILFIVNRIAIGVWNYPVVYCQLKEVSWLVYTEWVSPLMFIAGFALIGFGIMRMYGLAVSAALTILVVGALPGWAKTLFGSVGGTCYGS